MALIIDGAICFFSIPLVFTFFGWLLEKSGILGLILIPVYFAMFAAWPFLYFGIFTGLWGKTPGKFLCRLSVIYGYDKRPGLWRGLGRESLKLLTICSFIGAFLSFWQILAMGVTWYDNMCKTDVIYKPYVRLTKTQKRYRKFMKEQRG